MCKCRMCEGAEDGGMLRSCQKKDERKARFQEKERTLEIKEINLHE